MTDTSTHPPLLILCGPTGTGKTAVGIALCEAIGGEIISADSMQVYRGCNIGTAKASDEELARVRHHLVDTHEPQQDYSSAQWASDAVAAIADIRARGKQPVLVGGTGFYITSLLHPERLAGAPPNPELREKLYAEAETQGVEALHSQLAQVDAAAAARLHPNDVRRVVRALEVAIAGQETPGDNEALCGKTALEPAYRFLAFGLDMPREQLYRRLENRIDDMLRLGFMDELRWLAGLPGGQNTLALQSLGYRQMLPVLETPELFNECVELWKRDTRRYAKRQLTWFRHQLPVQWIALDATTPPAESAAKIEQLWRRELENTPESED